MEHYIINGYGYSLGVKSNRMVIYKNSEFIKEVSLNTIKTIQINSNGIKLSSDLIFALSANNIKIFFNKDKNNAALHTMHEHKTASVRLSQYKFCNNNITSINLAKNIIENKIVNQKNTIIYGARNILSPLKDESVAILNHLQKQLKEKNNREEIMGIEGRAAFIYFDCLQELDLFPKSFKYRTKKNSKEITNVALNYGYAILLNRIYAAAVQHGLDSYCGVLHAIRSGKPSLILDIMEQYRSYVVDRAVVRLKSRLSKTEDFEEIKSDLAFNILKNFEKTIQYRDTEITVNELIQKQLVSLKSHICADKEYTPFVFKW